MKRQEFVDLIVDDSTDSISASRILREHKVEFRELQASLFSTSEPIPSVHSSIGKYAGLDKIKMYAGALAQLCPAKTR